MMFSACRIFTNSSREISQTIVKLQDHVLIVVLLGGIVGHHFEPLDIAQLAPILLIVAAVDRDELLEAIEGGQAHRRGDFAHLAVGADVDDIVVPGKAEVLHQPDLRRQVIIVRDDGPAFEGIHELRGVETEDLGIAERADHPPVVRAAEGVRGIEQQPEMAPPGDPLQSLHVARPAPDVHADNPGGAGRDRLLDARRIQGVRPRVDIAEDRRDLLPLQGVRRGDEGERGHNHLALQSQGANGDLQGHGAVAHGDAVLDAHHVGDPPLEFLNIDTGIRQPPTIQNVVDPLQQAVPIPDVGPAHVELVRKRRLAAEDRQFIQCLDHIHRSSNLPRFLRTLTCHSLDRTASGTIDWLNRYL